LFDVGDSVLRHLSLFLVCTAALWPASRAERYVLVLEQPAAAAGLSSKDAARQAMADRRQKILAGQTSLREALAGKKIRVTSANQLLANVVFVESTAGQVEIMRSLPGVARVERVRPLKLHLNQAVDLMKVPAAWGVVNGEQNAGAGVKIGVLDTGIDHTHPSFKDDAFQFPAGFPKCQEARGDCAYTNRKVIVARSYVEMLVGSEPEFSRPDDLSPRDRVGHGTAVASVAAGVRSTGPGGTIAGVAPKAWLGNYKVFGSPGVNGRYTYDAVIIQALEDALNDGMDIVTVSLGAPAVWGPADAGADCGKTGTAPCDWRAEAIQNAAALGLVVVVSAGNDGAESTRFPAFNSVETPGTAPAAITVGATTNRHIWYQSLKLEGQNLPFPNGVINTLFGDGPKPNPTLTAPVKDVSKLDNDGKACTALTNGSLTGAFALIERGDCSLLLKVNYAQRAGAVGVIVYQSRGIEGTFGMSGLQETAIPATLIGNRAGVTLKDFIASRPEVRLTMDPALFSVSTPEFDTLAVTSSRGPVIFRANRPTAENGIKPEVVAVGTDLYMATQKFDPNGEMYDSTGYTAASGTSFAAPIVAGVAAMVKQRNPRMRPADIKSAVVNTASDEVFDFDSAGRRFKVGVLESGAGKLNAEAAVRTNVTAEPATLWFGVLSSAGTVSRGLTMRNFGSNPVSLRLTIVDYGDVNSRLTVAPTTMNIAPGGTGATTIRFEGAKPSPGIYEGVVEVTGGVVPLFVPFLYLVGDGVPYSILPLQGIRFEGDAGQVLPLSFKVTDRFGVPIPDQAVRFQTVAGGGSIDEQGASTDALGIGWADVVLGRRYGEQEFFARVGNSENFGVYFTGRARLAPSLQTGGVVNAASLQVGRGLAPGSYISIFGRGLSEVTRVFNTPYLPLALAGVSVSFDVPSKNLSAPGRIHFVSDGQINVQIPWELQGANTAMMKVSIGDSSSTVVAVPLIDHSPAAFEYVEQGSGRSFIAALDSGSALIGTANPALKGEVIQLYVNGLGPVDNQPASGEPASGTTLSPTRVLPAITIGGQAAEVVFSGLAPFNVGLYQVNVRVPANISSGLQPVIITANGIQSKSSGVPVE
jgi:minor extracellular serine protease Vpr